MIKAKKATGDLKDMVEAGVLEAMTLVEDYFWYITGTMFAIMLGITFYVWKSTPGEFTGWNKKVGDEGDEGKDEGEGDDGEGEGEYAESEGKEDEGEESDGEVKPTLKRRTRTSKK